ncbi:MAG: filamentous hemagglutinin N-terminal domain-containing protein, partial [Alcanivoracaceae bacterium]
MKWKMETLLSARRRLTMLALPTLLATSLGMSAHAVDLPSGEDIRFGDADIFRDSNSLTVDQHTSNLIINWQDFSIAAGNTVNFLQQRSDMVLNRVVGDNPSNIFGSINAGGQVFLINQSGILFAPGARVDAGGLVASTLDMADADFLSGNYLFEGAGGDVINQGQLVAADGGYIALFGRQAINEGIISARLGSVALASGDRIAMDFTGDGLIRLEVDRAVVDGLVSNHNLIFAEGGRVYMTASAAGDLAATVVNNQGIIEATGVEERDGQVFLTANGGSVSHSGTIDVSGAGEGAGGAVLVDSDATTLVSGSISATSGAQAGVGGSVQVLGDLVGITNGAVIDVSGVNGGGEILIGGDYQGGNADVRNASRTFVGNATLMADAIENGDGGRIIVWADEVTRFYGSLSATGGANGGDGGFAEVSGKKNLGFYGSVDLTAAYGAIGTLLLDPEILQIVNTGGTLDGNVPTINFADGGATDTVGVDVINAAGASIILEAGQIEFLNSDDIVLAAGNSISFSADSVAAGGGNGSITNPGLFSFSINTSGAGTISFDADGLINLAGISLNSDSAVSLTSGSSVALGNIDAGSLDITAAGNIVHSSGLNSVIVSGQTNLNADTNAITVSLDSATNDFNNVVLGGTGSFTSVSVRDATGLTIGGDAGTLFANAGGALEFTGGSYTTVNGTAGGNVSQSGALTVSGTTTLTSNAGPITANLTTATNDFGTVTLVSAGGSFTSASITDANALSVGGDAGTLNADAGGTLNFTGGSYTTLNGTAGGNISQSGPGLNVSGTTTLTADNADITAVLTTGSNNFGTVALASAGTGSFTSASITDVNAVNVGGDAGSLTVSAGGLLDFTGGTYGSLTVLADGDVIQSGALTVSGNANLITFTAGQTIDLSNAANEFSTVSISGGTGDFDSVSITDADTADNGLTLTGQTADLTIDAGGAFHFTGGPGSSTYTTANITAGGDITKGGPLNIGTLNLTSNVAPIDVTLDGNNNQYGTVTMTSVGLGSFDTVTFQRTGASMFNIGGDANSLTVLAGGGPLNLTGGVYTTLDLSAAGAITQSDAVEVSGTTTFSPASGSSSVDLNNAGNEFNIVNLNADTNPLTVSLFDADTANNGLTIGGANQNTVSLTVSAGGDIDFTDGAGVGAGAGSTSYSTVSATAVGDITQSGILNISGVSSFNAGASNIDLTNGSNNFGGAVTVTGNSVSITDNGALTIGGNATSLTAIAGGALGFTGGSYTTLNGTARGNITQSGALTVSGVTTLTADTNTITATLTDAANNFNSVALATTNGGSFSNVSVTDSNALAIGGDAAILTAIAGGALDFTGGSYTTLNTTTTDNITQTGILTVAGTADFTAGGDITLDQANAISGAVSLDGAAATIVNDPNLILAASDVDSLVATSNNGTITQAGILTVAGTAGFTAAGAITLGLDNDISGAVSLNGAAATIVNDPNLILAASDVDSLVATSNNGTITQTGILTVAGTADFTANGDITLDQANAISGAVSLNGAAATIVNDPSLILAASVVDSLVATSNSGTVTQTGILTVAGAADFTAAGAITLNLDNDISGAVSLNGAAATIVNNPNLILAASNVDSLVATSNNGTITQTGILTVGGTADFTANGDITLDQANAISGAVSLDGAAATIVNDPNLILAASDVASLIATSNSGTITQTGILTVAGTADFTAASDITLELANEFGDAVLLDGAAVIVVNEGDLDLGVSNVDSLEATSNTGAITQSGILTVAGVADFAAATDITLDLANEFGGAILIDGAAVVLVNDGDLDLGALDVDSLVATSNNGAITVNGVITSDGVVSLNADTTIVVADAITTQGGDFSALAGRNILVTGDITTLGGDIIMIAHDGGGIAEIFIGIHILDATLDVTGGGDDGTISLTGTGGDDGNGNEGVRLQSGAELIASGGAITIDGTGGNGTNNNSGVFIAGGGTQVTSVDGDIQITGLGGGSGSSNYGVFFDSGAVVSSTGTGADAATITIDGTGGSGLGGNTNIGVFIRSAGTQITSVDGAIQIAGQGGGSGNGNHGVLIQSGAVVSSTGTGVDAASITIDGTGGNGSFNNRGVSIDGVSAQVTSVDGDIQITGQGAGTGGNNYGVVVGNGALVSSTGAGADAATITIEGIGGSGPAGNSGVFIHSVAEITSIGADIHIIGEGGDASSDGVVLSGGLIDSGSTLTLSSVNGITLNAAVTSDGTTTIHADSDNDGDGALTVTANGSVTTTDNALNVVASDVTLTGTLDSGAAATTITASNDGNIGLGSAAGDLTVTDVQLGNITANGLEFITTGTGAIAVNETTAGNTGDFGTLTLTSASTVNFESGGTVLENALDATGATGVTVLGNLTSNTGSIDLTATSNSITLGANITTTDSNIDLNGDVVLSAATALTTGAGAGDITVTGTINGAQTLALTAGAGSIDLQSAVGDTTPLQTLTVNSASTATFGGNVTTNLGESVTADTIELSGNHSVAGAGAILLDGNVDLLAATSLQGGPGGGSVTVTGTIDGAQTLDITANAGSVNLQSEVGGTTPLTSLNVTGIGGITLGGDVTTVGSQTFTTGGAPTSTSGTHTTTNSDILFASGLTLLADTTLDTGAGGGNVTVTGTTGGAFALDITAGTGDVDFQNAVNGLASLTINSAATATFNVVAVTTGIQDITADLINVGGTHATTDSDLLLTGDVVLSTGTSLSTGAGAGDIIVTGTVNGAQTLNISAGTGDVELQSDVGDTTPLTSLIISSGTTATLGGNVTTTANQVYNANTTETNGIHTTTGANIQVINALVALTDTTFDTGAALGGTVFFQADTDGPGAVTVTAGTGNFDVTGSIGATTPLASLTVNSATVATFGGDVTTTGVQNVTATTINTNGTHTTTDSDIDLNGAVVLQAATALTTGAGAGDITVTGTINGAQTLDLTAGTGSIDLQSAVGDTTPLASLTVNSATAATFGDDVTTTGVQDVTATTINTNGTHTTTDSDIDLNGAVVLQAATALTTGAGAGDITVTGTINGAQTLDLTAGTGSIDLQSAVGDTTPLTSLTVNSATDVDLAAVTAGSVTQLAGTGTTTVAGVMNANTGDISITTESIVQDADMTATGNVLLNAAAYIELNEGVLTANDRLIHLISGGAGVEQNFDTLPTHGGLVASELLLEGTGSFNLLGEGVNQIGTVAGDVNGTVAFINSQALTIGSVTDLLANTTDGLTAETLLVLAEAGDLTVSEAATATTGNLGLFTDDGGILIDAAVVGAALIDIEQAGAVGDITFTVDGSIAANGDMSLVAENNIVMANGATATAVGNGRVEAGGDITLGGVSADNLRIETAGAIIDGGDTDIDASANNLQLVAGNDIGTDLNAIEIDAGTLAVSSATGSAYLVADSGLIIGEVATFDVPVINAPDGSTVPDTIGALTGASAAVGLFIEANGGIRVDEAVTATTGDLLLDAQSGDLVINAALTAGGNASLLASAN